MTTQQNQRISAKQATGLLKAGHPLIDLHVDGELKIENDEKWDEEVLIDNCDIECFSALMTYFQRPVKLKNCHFKKCRMTFAYFCGGLTIDNCVFDDYLDFQCGGHNKTGNPIRITNNRFKDFVNFFDCWYESEVTIDGNTFSQGTNLLGKPQGMAVTFDIDPIIQNNIGKLDLDNE